MENMRMHGCNIIIQRHGDLFSIKSSFFTKFHICQIPLFCMSIVYVRDLGRYLSLAESDACQTKTQFVCMRKCLNCAERFDKNVI